MFAIVFNTYPFHVVERLTFFFHRFPLFGVFYSMIRKVSPNRNTRFRQSAARFFGPHNNAHPARMNDVCNVRIVPGSYQIWCCLFSAHLFGQCLNPGGRGFIVRNDYLRRLFPTVKQMVFRARVRVHQMQMECFGTQWPFESERQNAAILKPDSGPVQYFPVRLFPG